jgi:hypothetical protein
MGISYTVVEGSGFGPPRERETLGNGVAWAAQSNEINEL